MAASDTLASSGDEETQNNASTSDDLSAEDSDEEADSSGAAAEPRAAAVRGSRRRQLTTSASVPMFEHGGGVSDCSDTEVTELGGSEADLMRMEEGPLALQLSQVTPPTLNGGYTGKYQCWILSVLCGARQVHHRPQGAVRGE